MVVHEFPLLIKITSKEDQHLISVGSDQRHQILYDSPIGTLMYCCCLWEKHLSVNNIQKKTESKCAQNGFRSDPIAFETLSDQASERSNPPLTRQVPVDCQIILYSRTFLDHAIRAQHAPVSA